MDTEDEEKKSGRSINPGLTMVDVAPVVRLNSQFSVSLALKVTSDQWLDGTNVDLRAALVRAGVRWRVEVMGRAGRDGTVCGCVGGGWLLGRWWGWRRRREVLKSTKGIKKLQIRPSVTLVRVSPANNKCACTGCTAGCANIARRFFQLPPEARRVNQHTR